MSIIHHYKQKPLDLENTLEIAHFRNVCYNSR